jgi:superfamily I DNA/RNA helicase
MVTAREDSSVRGRWQSAYQYVPVDEYQDIEPAQELLVRLVAAPHDQLFCVGDEDQTLYAFRRASVERIILLDKLYPALERVALGVNYRCPPAVVEASRTLIEHNKVRFPKQIAAGQPHSHGSPILVRGFASKPESAVVAAQTLKDRVRGEIVVLDASLTRCAQRRLPAQRWASRSTGRRSCSSPRVRARHLKITFASRSHLTKPMGS